MSIDYDEERETWYCTVCNADLEHGDMDECPVCHDEGTWVVFNGMSGYSDETMRFPTYDQAEFFMEARGEDSEDTYCVRYEPAMVSHG